MALFFDAKHLPEANITDGLCSDLDSEQLSTAQLFQRAWPLCCMGSVKGFKGRSKTTFEQSWSQVTDRSPDASVFNMATI
jgi:hypothetical protein